MTKMDQNGSLKRSNNYHLFFKKTLQFLVPVSLLSFLLAYASCFSFINYPYNFHFSTLVLPILSHALERKYMFLICNGILAFLAKTPSFNSNSSSPSATDFIHDHESMKSTVIEKSVTFEETRLPSQYSQSVPLLEDKEEEEENNDDANGNNEGKFQNIGSSLIIESTDDIYSEDDDYDTEESASASEEQGNEINLNTEELNQKCEEFIRKMKEEIRIEAQQQLVVA